MKKTGSSLLGVISIILVMSACKNQPSYNGHEYVDLGLSVKWATCNVGAENPEDYGDYYAWGEISSKSTYTWMNYRFRDSGESFMTLRFSKYYPEIEPDPTGNNTTLELTDDVANQEWCGNWRMPTKQEIEELYNNCDWTWTTQNGISGVKITSKVEGYTDRSIFIPAAGARKEKELFNTGEYVRTWSSSLTQFSGSAYDINFGSSASSLDITYSYDDRYLGLPVRAVCP